MRSIFHITTRMAWEKAKACGRFDAESLSTEGFIHLSRPHQVLSVANFRFKGVPGLLLLHVNEEKVASPLKYESADGDKFPHAYGPLNLDAVIGSYDFLENAAGFIMPEPLRLVGDALIRPGQPGDEAEITSVHTHAWQQSYKNIIPGNFLDERPLSFYSRQKWWSSVVEGKDPWSVFVAESALHGIIGFCGFGPSRDTEFKNHGEIGAIYCLKEYKGKSIGAALLRDAQGRQKLAGHSYSYLWVLQGNPTIDFYRRMGGIELEKKKTVEFGGQNFTEIAFEWKL